MGYNKCFITKRRRSVLSRFEGDWKIKRLYYPFKRIRLAFYIVSLFLYFSPPFCLPSVCYTQPWAFILCGFGLVYLFLAIHVFNPVERFILYPIPNFIFLLTRMFQWVVVRDSYIYWCIHFLSQQPPFIGWRSISNLPP